MFNKTCLEVNEHIWMAGAGGALPEQAEDHIARCKRCAHALREARQIVVVIPKVGEIAAPDCRGVVLSQIAPQPSQRRLASVLGLGVAAAIVIVAVMLVGRLRPESPDVVKFVPHIANPVGPAASHTASVDKPTTHAARVDIAKADYPRQNESKRYRRHGLRRLIGAQTRVPDRVAQKQPAVEVIVLPNVAVAEAPTPVASDLNVRVTWYADGGKPDHSYSYTERDPDSGKIIRSTGRRTGDSIFLSIQPALEQSGEPLKGLLNDKINPNA